MAQTPIKNKHQFRVRFRDCDPLKIVWHGNYLTYFEDGREAFGRDHGISYLEIQENGFVAPIVKAVCDYKFPLKYGDVASVETTFIPVQAAKMIFNYTIFNQENRVICTGETIQVFLDLERNLQLNNPPFFEEWKEKVLSVQ